MVINSEASLFTAANRSERTVSHDGRPGKRAFNSIVWPGTETCHNVPSFNETTSAPSPNGTARLSDHGGVA
jgi:hypothetical protein